MAQHAHPIEREFTPVSRPLKVPVGHGWHWIADGFRLFTRAPLTLIAMVVLWFLAAAALSFIPLLGPIAATVLAPVLFGGFMLACDRLQRDEAITVSLLFSGFSGHGGALTLVGALYLAGLLLLGLVANIFDLLAGSPAGPTAAGPVAAAVLASALSIPLTMALWHAPALVILKQYPPAAAMRQSFLGAAANLPAFLVFLLLSLALSIVAAIPALLGYLIWGPVALSAVYCSFRDIYHEQPSPLSA